MRTTILNELPVELLDHCLSFMDKESQMSLFLCKNKAVSEQICNFRKREILDPAYFLLLRVIGSNRKLIESSSNQITQKAIRKVGLNSLTFTAIFVIFFGLLMYLNPQMRGMRFAIAFSMLALYFIASEGLKYKSYKNDFLFGVIRLLRSEDQNVFTKSFEILCIVNLLNKNIIFARPSLLKGKDIYRLNQNEKEIIRKCRFFVKNSDFLTEEQTIQYVKSF